MPDKYDVPPANGKCVGMDTNLWFPLGKSGMNKSEITEFRRNIKIAVDVCKTCDVSEHCLRYSLRHEPYGIWGGKTESERALIRAKYSIQVSRDGRVFVPGVSGKRTSVRTANNRVDASQIVLTKDVEELGLEAG